jgi:hypothetical protein
MVKYISFKIGRELFQRYTFEFEINSAQKQEDYDRIVINFYLKIMDRTQELCPALLFREQFIGYIMSRSCLFYPEWPAQDVCADPS